MLDGVGHAFRAGTWRSSNRLPRRELQPIRPSEPRRLRYRRAIGSMRLKKWTFGSPGMDSNHRPDGKQPPALPLSYQGPLMTLAAPGGPANLIVKRWLMLRGNPPARPVTWGGEPHSRTRRTRNRRSRIPPRGGDSRRLCDGATPLPSDRGYGPRRARTSWPIGEGHQTCWNE
jgi:hypothetical protein